MKHQHCNPWAVWAITLLSIIVLLLCVELASAHNHAKPELNEWYRGLHSNSGSWCCDGEEATHLSEVDWDAKDGHYRVRLNDQWVDVPDGAIIEKPNLDGETMVWPIYGPNGSLGIRCFIPGAGG